MAKPVDLRKIMARVGRLQAVFDAACAVRAAAIKQAAMLPNCDPYYVVGSDPIDELFAAIDRAAASDDGNRDVARLATSGRVAVPVWLEPDDATEIRFPYAPNRELSANRQRAKSHWSTVSGDIKAEKARAINALANDRFAEPLFAGSIAVDVTVGWGTALHAGPSRAAIGQERPLDWDGLTLCLKPMQDAMQAAGIFKNDGHIRDTRIRQTVDATGAGFTLWKLWGID